MRIGIVALYINYYVPYNISLRKYKVSVMCIAMTIIGKVFQACYLIEGKPLKSKIFLGIG